MSIIEKYNATTDQLSGVPTSLDEELCELISKRNTYLSPVQVRQSLLNGKLVYTSFNYYVLKTD